MEKIPQANQKIDWKSKWKEITALAAAGITLFEYVDFKSKSYEPEWERIKNEAQLDLQPLEDVARAKIEVVGEKYIIHIAQMHGANSLNKTKESLTSRGSSVESLIECQKQIEKTLTYLNERYGLSTVYLESLTQQYADLYNAQLEDLKEDRVGTSIDLYTKAHSGNSEWASEEEFLRAHMLVFAHEASKGTELGHAAENDPLIAGDLRYVWGSPYILAAQGKITLKPAEDHDVNQRAVTLGLTSEEGHHVRETAAIRLIEEGIQSTEGPVALVYGAAHNFKESVQTHNSATSKNGPLGLIRIDPHACVL